MLELRLVVLHCLPVGAPVAARSLLQLHFFHELLQFPFRQPLAAGLVLLPEYLRLRLFAEPKSTHFLPHSLRLNRFNSLVVMRLALPSVGLLLFIV